MDWQQYLDVAERRLESIHAGAAPAGAAYVEPDAPEGPLPAELWERARRLLDQTVRAEVALSTRRDEVSDRLGLVSKRRSARGGMTQVAPSLLSRRI